MTKIQKVLVIMFLIMFLVTEIFFSQTILSVLYLFGLDLSIIMFDIIKEPFFLDLSFIIEIIGIFGLLFFNIKFNKDKDKLAFSILLSIMLVVTILYFLSILTFSFGSGFMS